MSRSAVGRPIRQGEWFFVVVPKAELADLERAIARNAVAIRRNVGINSYIPRAGKPHVVEFRCPHRQTQLSVGWVEGDCIRCRFHGWKFDSSGQCIEQPAEENAFCHRYGL